MAAPPTAPRLGSRRWRLPAPSAGSPSPTRACTRPSTRACAWRRARSSRTSTATTSTSPGPLRRSSRPFGVIQRRTSSTATRSRSTTATARQTPYWVLPPDPDYLRRVGFLAQPAVFWRRSAYEQLGPFDESLRYRRRLRLLDAGHGHAPVRQGRRVPGGRARPRAPRSATRRASESGRSSTASVPGT